MLHAGSSACGVASAAGRGRSHGCKGPAGWREPVKRGRSRGLRVLAAAAREDAEAVKSAERRRRMLAYVREAEPASVLEEFLITESPVVVGAMRHTITNMLGTLSSTPQFFTVTVSTVAENLAMLMNTVMLTGYMFKSAADRYSLRSALGGSSGDGSSSDDSSDGGGAPTGGTLQQLLPGSGRSGLGGGASRGGGSGSSSGSGGEVSAASLLEDGDYAPGVQKSRVQGEVLRWHKEQGLESMSAVEYIERLEGEVARLRAAAAPPPPLRRGPRLPPAAAWGLDAAADEPAGAAEAARPLPERYDAARRQHALAVRPPEERNELLEFIRALEPSTVGELTACASPEAAAAMDAFVERLLGLGGGADRDALRRAASETDAAELRKLLFWLMVVGWRLRAMEMQIELERALD
ncbi:hypothetical protein Rsub_01554 [Raphidocelis subcapitata]|uniref:Uncharacterized protein n=1 Tax=Raphidocelis subcapitata TaxID=307507 RepID=A0A2V0NV02_9CHLO|nr:hypothetical protein Rsub_01554 [Raphidocelis subcapitata]|eukprot:GBF88655.1 hypothetical protein Rsub_01554 [Raphidocelis subcapitata]